MNHTVVQFNNKHKLTIYKQLIVNCHPLQLPRLQVSIYNYLCEETMEAHNITQDIGVIENQDADVGS